MKQFKFAAVEHCWMFTDIEREEDAGETDSEGRKAWVYGYDLPVESIIEVAMSANEDTQRKRAALC